MAAGLAGNLVVEVAQGARKVFAAEIAGQLQAGMTSSLTKWRRITEGFSPSLK